MHTFILAGGYATRLWPLTERRAKPLLPLAGKPILTHIVEKIPEDIPVTVSTNAGFGGDFRKWRESIQRSNICIRIEETKSDDDKLGALGAVSQWVTRDGIKDDILLLTGDNYFGFSLKSFVSSYKRETPILAAFDIGDRSKAGAFGTVILDEDGRSITGFEEKPPEPKSSIVSTGCSIIPARAIPLLVVHAVRHPDNVGGIFEELLRRKFPVDCFIFSEPWFDIGSFEAYLEATRALVHERAIVGIGARMEETETSGSIVIGSRSVVRGSTLKDVVLFEDCLIEDCVLEDCIVDNRCVLKGIDLRGKMLRAGSHIVRPQGR